GLNMLQTVKLSARFIRIWPELVKLPRELYPALEELVKKMTNTGDDGLVLLYALKIVKGIPAAEAKVLLNDASDFLRGFGQEDLGTSLKMLESISQLSVEKRGEVV